VPSHKHFFLLFGSRNAYFSAFSGAADEHTNIDKKLSKNMYDRLLA